MPLGCSSGVVGGPPAVVVRRRDGIAPRAHIRSLAERRESKAPGLRADVGRWLCRLSGLILGRRSEMLAAVLVEVPRFAFAAAGRNGMASWSCTGLDIPGEGTGCGRRLGRQLVDLYIVVVVVVVLFAAAVSRMNCLTVCPSRLAAN